VDIVAFVVAQSSALGDGLQLPGADDADVVFDGSGQIGNLQRVDGFAHVSAAGQGDAAQQLVLDLQGQPFLLRLLLQQLDAAFERLFNLLWADRLEFKDGAAADDGVVDIKIRIFGGGSNQGDLTVLQKFQQGLLLFFVQVLNLVQIEHHAVHSFKGVQRGDDLLKIGGAGSGAIELVQFFARLLCDDACHGGFSGAGRSVKD